MMMKDQFVIDLVSDHTMVCWLQQVQSGVHQTITSEIKMTRASSKAPMDILQQQVAESPSGDWPADI